LFLSLETILIYSASIIRSYMRLRSRLGSFLSKSEKNYVRMLSKTSRIEEWIAFRRWYEENHGPFHYKED